MYQFASNRDSLIVCLHKAGKRIGEARFHHGEWQTDSDEMAEAMMKAAEQVPQYAIHPILKVTLEADAPAAPLPVQPTAASQPRSASRRRHRKD